MRSLTKKAPEFSLPIKIGEEQTDAQVCLFQSETYNDEFIILFRVIMIKIEHITLEIK